MRLIARNVLVEFWGKHPEAKPSVERWYALIRAAGWTSTDDVQKAAPRAKVLIVSASDSRSLAAIFGWWPPSISVVRSRL